MPQPLNNTNDSILSVIGKEFPQFADDVLQRQFHSTRMQKEYGLKFRKLLLRKANQEEGIFDLALTDESFRNHLLKDNYDGKNFSKKQYLKYLKNNGQAGLLEAKLLGQLFNVNVFLNSKSTEGKWTLEIHRAAVDAPTIVLNNFDGNHFFLETPNNTHAFGKNLCLYNCFVEFAQQLTLLKANNEEKEYNDRPSQYAAKGNFGLDNKQLHDGKVKSVNTPSRHGQPQSLGNNRQPVDKMTNVQMNEERNMLQDAICQSIPLAKSPVIIFNTKGQSKTLKTTSIEDAILRLYDSMQNSQDVPEDLDQTCAEYQKEEIENFLTSSS